MKLLDVVRLARDLSVTVDLPKGYRGTIVEELPADVLVTGERAFIVEFSDDEGRGFTLDLAESDITAEETIS